NDGDGSGNVALGTFNMDIAAVNDDPTNSGTFPTDIAVTEDVAGNVDLSGMTLADVDITDNVTLTLTATGGTLAASPGGGVTAGGSGTGTLTLTGTAANVDTFLNTITNIKYTGAAHANGADAETVAVKVNDNNGSGDIALGTFNVDIASVNDLAALNLDANDSSGAGGNNFAATFLAGGSAVKIADTDTALTDADDTNMDSAVITLSAGVVDGANESISINGTPAAMGGVTIGYTSAIQIDLSGSATLADYQAVIEAIEYNNSLGAATAGDRTITVKVNDGENDSNTATSTITVQAMPEITSAAYDANTGQLVITGTDFLAHAGADLIASMLTITGEGGAYTLTDTANVEISSATEATLTLSATDKLHVDGLLNKNGFTS
ncbi:MAG: hypothetical protein GY727_03300, partial [Gammaproteobacteria bacterium]|nr:hypothetical protein [Gammaproteobacteria bacterium]